MKKLTNIRNFILGYLEELDLIIELDAKDMKPNNEKYSIQSTNPVDKTKVFVVHGHDDETKKNVTDFLISLQLMPIILHQQTNEGMTIIEKFEKYSDVSFAVVILTPDDVGDSKRNMFDKLNTLHISNLSEDMKIVKMSMKQEITDSQKKKLYE